MINTSSYTKWLMLASALLIAMVALLYGCASTSNSQHLDTRATADPVQSNNTAPSSEILVAEHGRLSAPTPESNQRFLEPSIDDSMMSTYPSAQNNAAPTALITVLKNNRPGLAHVLQNKFTEPNEQRTAIKGASLLQNYLDDPTVDATTVLRRYDCVVISLTQDDQNLIKSLTVDTSERKALLRDGLKNYQPPVSIDIPIDTNGEAISPCTIIMEGL